MLYLPTMPKACPRYTRLPDLSARIPPNVNCTSTPATTPSRRTAPQHWRDALGPKSGGPAAQPVIAHTLAWMLARGSGGRSPGLSDVFPPYGGWPVPWDVRPEVVVARPGLTNVSPVCRTGCRPWLGGPPVPLAGRMLAAGPAAARPGPAGWPCSGPVIAHPGLADGPVLWRGMLARLPPVAAPRGLGDVRPCGADRSPTAMVGGDTVAHCGGAVRLRRPDRAARNRQHWARLICSSWNESRPSSRNFVF